VPGGRPLSAGHLELWEIVIQSPKRRAEGIVMNIKTRHFKRLGAFLVGALLLLEGSVLNAADLKGTAQARTEGGVLRGELRFDELGVLEAPGPEAEVSSRQAIAIARGFLALEVKQGSTAWQGARIGRVIPFWSVDGLKMAYEAEVLSASGEAQGSIFVEAWKALGPISAFSTQGPTTADILLRQWEEENGSRLEDEGAGYRFLWSAPAAAALQVFLLDGGTRFVSPIPGLDASSFQGIERLIQAALRDTETFPDSRWSPKREREELRKAYRERNFDGPLFQGRRSSLELSNRGGGIHAPATVGLGSSNFSHYKQEIRTWSKSANSTYKCYTGCMPVAFGIVLEYWDRKGYPKMVGTDKANSYTSHTNDVVRAMLDTLRGHLGTYCEKTDGTGLSPVSKASRALDYINGRGVGTWKSDTTNSSLYRWSRVMSEIDKGNPPVIHFDSSGKDSTVNHSAATYEYRDNWGISNDWACTETGWGDARCFQRTLLGSYYVTRVMRP